MRFNQQILCVTLLWTLASPSMLAQEAERPGELVHLDLKDLMNIEITSVSRRPERLSDAAASIFVITADDIRRSGATNLPEALRLAPNLDIVQTSASNYTVSARGFINSAANKLLVLIDGRSVYTPLFSGIFWDVQDVLLEDVDRIEVISGPGGTLWGVNAVNGVINIITRSAKDARDGLLLVGGGNRVTVGGLRYGGTAGRNGDYSVYSKYFNRPHTETVTGKDKDDSWYRSMAGLRGDWERARDQFTLLGTAYRGSEGLENAGRNAVRQPISTGARITRNLISISGVNLTARWKRQLHNDSSISVLGYFDHTERVVPPTFGERLNLFDLQLLQSWRPLPTHNVSWGAEYRYGMDRVTNSAYIAFLPARVNQKWSAVFAQDEITLWKGFRLSLGARSEHNDYTGNEFLPNVRLAWNLATGHLLWTAASRTVRAPSRLDRDTFVPGKPPFVVAGGPDVVSEIAKVYEAGYRGQLASSATLSATVFHSLYNHLRTQELIPGQKTFTYANGMEGTTTGFEMWSSYQISRICLLSVGFNTQSERFNLKPGSSDTATLAAQQGRDPRRSWKVRSSFDLSRQSELDLTVRYVSERSTPSVPAYSSFDLHYGWRPRPGMEISVTGSNLFDKGHGEFTDISTRTEIGRGVFVKFVSHFGRGS